MSISNVSSATPPRHTPPAQSQAPAVQDQTGDAKRVVSTSSPPRQPAPSAASPGTGRIVDLSA